MGEVPDGGAARSVRRVPERYQWEKDRVLLPVDRRWGTGAAERDSGLPFERFAFQARYETVAADADLAGVFGVAVGAGLSTVGVELDRIVDRLTARAPTTAEAEALGLPSPAVPVLVLRKTSIDTTGRVVEVSDLLLPGDRSELIYTSALARWPTS
jgi:GntR family transcriptional regulator